MSQTVNPVIRLREVSLRIPVISDRSRSLKASLIRSVTGGRLLQSHGGPEVLALDSVSLSIAHGERVALIGHNGAASQPFCA